MSVKVPKPELIKAIQAATRTGQIVYGTKRVIKLALQGKAKLIVIAANTPPEIKHDIVYYARLGNIPVIVFEGTNIELGGVVGRPHSICAFAVLDPGQSRILELAVGEK